jgi:hypothetical protein
MLKFIHVCSLFLISFLAPTAPTGCLFSVELFYLVLTVDN